MNLKKLIESVEYCKRHAVAGKYVADNATRQETIYDLHETLKTLKSLEAVLDKTENGRIWDWQVLPISMNDACNILNVTSYDEYGKLARANNGQVSIEDFEQVVYKQYIFDDMYREFLSSGYDIVKDLWDENEAYGNNKPDGTYNKDN